MRKAVVIPALALVLAFMAAPQAHALSCLPLDMYLDTVVNEEGGETLVFTGTATKVSKDHEQVVTVTEAHKGYVAPELWVKHAYSTDWQYFCSNGPAKAGEETVFLVTIDEYGTFKVVQTLDADSTEAKEFIKDLESKKVDAGITDVDPEDREAEVLASIQNLYTAFLELLRELRYWQSR